MISTRDMKVYYRAPLQMRHGGGFVEILGDGARFFIKRMVARNNVVNVVDRYERVDDKGNVEICKLDDAAAQAIVHELQYSKKSWAACFVVGAKPVAALDWVKSPQEHQFTSTGIKFWRHKEAMESYRAGTGRSVISTHISPEGACNLKCPYCSVTYRDTHSRIALHRILQYVTDLQSRGLKAVILTGGGEPTLYPYFNELVQWIKGRGLSVALITNGTTSKKVTRATWRCFSWVRVSVNIFDGWEERIELPREQLADGCVVGCSHVYSVEHEATKDEVPLDRVELFGKISKIADKVGAQYIRLLPNCLLEQDQLVLEHHSLKAVAEKLGDPRFFQQYKVHGAPDTDMCHQAYFRPYLSEEPFQGGEPGTVYPCDSVVLNDAATHFAAQYQLCKPEDVLKFLDGEIKPRFEPRLDCTGCVFTGNVEMLADWKFSGDGEFLAAPLVHEEFV